MAAEIAERRGLDRARIWATGYPAMDCVFHGGGARPAGKRPTVLYAPTDRPMLSSAEMLGDEAVELIGRGRTDIDIVLKPHPRHAEAPPPWLAGWRELATRYPNVALIDDPAVRIADIMIAADVLISDVSSVMLEFLALDRLMVLISNPNRFNDSTHFDSAGYEWAWRDMGEEVHD
ncbi:MAG: CDP-glycerol glycerophosphotransferase family protein, partial [Rhodospirillaceae bacterium]